MDGYLLIDKPAGISSFGVVARIRGIIKAETGQKIKIGHTGTLDPVATGLLILVLGKYTKRAAEFSKLDKIYEVEATLGSVSTTADSEGEIKKVSDKVPTKDRMQEALKKFSGEIMQTPPAFSAMKIGGKRAYKLAREGKEVVLEPRAVQIHSLTDMDYEYPILKFTAHVSSGTYIRSLVEDIGGELNTGAYLSALKRTKISRYLLDDAVALETLNYKTIQSNLQK